MMLAGIFQFGSLRNLAGAALKFLNTFLLVFGFLAVFVGAFIVFNTFSMLVAQRTRELALLPAVGASRAQVTSPPR